MATDISPGKRSSVPLLARTPRRGPQRRREAALSLMSPGRADGLLPVDQLPPNQPWQGGPQNHPPCQNDPQPPEQLELPPGMGRLGSSRPRPALWPGCTLPQRSTRPGKQFHHLTERRSKPTTEPRDSPTWLGSVQKWLHASLMWVPSAPDSRGTLPPRGGFNLTVR
jgi:hypothetical protein